MTDYYNDNGQLHKICQASKEHWGISIHREGIAVSNDEIKSIFKGIQEKSQCKASLPKIKQGNKAPIN